MKNRIFTLSLGLAFGLTTISAAGPAGFVPELMPFQKDVAHKSEDSRHAVKNNATEKDPTTGFPGNLEAPDADTFEAKLDTQEDFDRFTCINTKDIVFEEQWGMMMATDGMGWMFSTFSGTACIINYTGSESDYDEWLITPELSLEAGKAYIISMTFGTDSWFNASKAEVKAGDAPTAEAMTETVFEPFTFIVDNDTNPVCGYYFVPERTGKYYIGIHAMGRNGFNMKNLRISSPGALPVPSEDEIKYVEETLLEADLTTLTEGTFDSPVRLDTDGWVNGLDGWLGNEVYSVAGEGILIKNSLDPSVSNGAALIPAFVDTKDYSLVRYSVTSRLIDLTQNFAMDTNLSTALLSDKDYAPTVYTSRMSYEIGLREGEVAESDWIVPIPDEPLMLYSANGDGTQYGEHLPDRMSMYIASQYHSNILVSNVKVSGLVPVVQSPANLRVTARDGESASVSWDYVENADEYVVRIYGNTKCYGTSYDIPSSYDLGAYEQYRTVDTSFDFVPTDSKSAVVVEVFALGDLTRSRSSYVRVIDVAEPEFSAIREEESGEISVEWINPENAEGTLVTLYKGEEITDPDPEYVIARVSADSMEDSGIVGGNRYFPGQEGSWCTSGVDTSVQDGAIVAQNNARSSLSIISNCAYDLSSVNGKVKFAFTAKADGPCMVTPSVVIIDDATKSYKVADHAVVSLSDELETYEVELAAADNGRFELNFGSFNKVYFRDLTISASMPGDMIFYKPVETRNIPSYEMGEAGFVTDAPAGPYKNIMAKGFNYRYEYFNGNTPSRVVFSPISEPVVLEKTEAAVDSVIQDEVSENDRPVYYTLLGVRVINPISGGVYLKVSGGKIEKVVF